MLCPRSRAVWKDLGAAQDMHNRTSIVQSGQTPWTDRSFDQEPQTVEAGD